MTKRKKNDDSFYVGGHTNTRTEHKYELRERKRPAVINDSPTSSSQQTPPSSENLAANLRTSTPLRRYVTRSSRRAAPHKQVAKAQKKQSTQSQCLQQSYYLRNHYVQLHTMHHHLFLQMY